MTPQLRSVSRFLGLRPEALGEDAGLMDALRDVLNEASDFEEVQSGSVREQRWEAAFRPVAGRPLSQRLDQWFVELERARERGRSGGGDVGGEGQDVDFVAAGLTYRVPRRHLPTPSGPPVLRTHPVVPQVPLDESSLRTLAKRIDAASRPGPKYEGVAVDGFLGRFKSGDHKQVREFRAGATTLAVAPTGTGKSVFARLIALHQAAAGVPVCIVVPDIPAVWKEVLRLEAAATSADLDLQIAPLSSWRGLAGHAARHLEHPPAEDPTGRWALERAAYSCHLAAYAEPPTETPAAGEEPCTRLKVKATHEGAKDSAAACPFAGQCGRFRGFEAALCADIIVVNHHAFLAGRVPFEVVVDEGTARKVSTAELVLRRCGLVLIDEVDGFQNSAIGANSRGLVLSSRGSLSMPYRLLTEVDRRRAERRLDAGLRFERGRSALLRIIHEAERLAELINGKELEWPERGRMTWLGARDPWIAELLFPGAEDGVSRVRALFDRQGIEEPRAEALRVALAPFAGPGLGDGTRMEDIRADLMASLKDWPMGGRRSPSAIQKEKSKLVDRLIVRAALLQLDKAVGHLRPQLPGLEQHEVQQAARLRDDLLGYAPWQPSPAGPLGQRVYGFAFAERLAEQGALETRVMAGDPHGLVAELGGVVARAWAGTPRAVVGLSATCRFRGSPRADVLGEVGGAVRDKARNMQVIQASVEARISGIGTGAERMEAARTAAKQLWASTLEAYLAGLMEDGSTRGRGRALLVTGSYREARAVGEGLRQAAGDALEVRYLVSQPADAQSDDDALLRTQLESFADVPAPAVLVGPLSVVARGHNIVQRGSGKSALSGIFVLTRPVPPSHDADRFLSHVSYNARLFAPEWAGAPHETVLAERRQAWRRLRALQRSAATFRHMDPELRRELVCDVLVELAQLAGRARRGGTPVDLVFVNGAFQDDVAPWRKLVADVLGWWRERGWLPEMTALHGALVHGLAEYTDFDLSGME
jgi:hypothetical protein